MKSTGTVAQEMDKEKPREKCDLDTAIRQVVFLQSFVKDIPGNLSQARICEAVQARKRSGQVPNRPTPTMDRSCRPFNHEVPC